MLALAIDLISFAELEELPKSFNLDSLNEGNGVFFFRMLAQSYTPNIYIPTPIPLLYNPFTIVLHKSLRAYPFRAAHTLAC